MYTTVAVADTGEISTCVVSWPESSSGVVYEIVTVLTPIGRPEEAVRVNESVLSALVEASTVPSSFRRTSEVPAGARPEMMGNNAPDAPVSTVEMLTLTVSAVAGAEGVEDGESAGADGLDRVESPVWVFPSGVVPSETASGVCSAAPAALDVSVGELRAVSGATADAAEEEPGVLAPSSAGCAESASSPDCGGEEGDTKAETSAAPGDPGDESAKTPETTIAATTATAAAAVKEPARTDVEAPANADELAPDAEEDPTEELPVVGSAPRAGAADAGDAPAPIHSA